MSEKSIISAQVHTLEELESTALAKRSVITGPFARPIPAAIMISMQGMTILNYIRGGLYLYEKPPSRSVFPRRKEGA